MGASAHRKDQSGDRDDPAEWRAAAEPPKNYKFYENWEAFAVRSSAYAAAAGSRAPHTPAHVPRAGL